MRQQRNRQQIQTKKEDKKTLAAKTAAAKTFPKKNKLHVSAADCLKVAIATFGNKVTAKRRRLQRGSWHHVPSGCTVYSAGDFAAHWNDLPGNTKGNDIFTKVEIEASRNS